MAKKKKKKTKKRNISKKTINKKKKKSTKRKSNNKKTTSKKTTSKKTYTKKKTNKDKTSTKKFNFKYIILILILLILVGLFYFIFYKSPTLTIKDISLSNDNVVHIKFKIDNNLSLRKKVYCQINSMDGTKDKDWFLVNDECTYKLDDEYMVYLKNEDNKIYVVDTSRLGRIENLKINDDKVYIPVKGSYEFKINYDKYGYINENIIWKSSNEKIATVKDGKVKGISKGEVTICASINGKFVTSTVIVTNLITTRPKNGFDFKKKKLSCNKYSKEENDLLDEILKDRINDVGYKTRAAAVEAARFLTLDFPYRINYFYENGRQTTNNVDGEGRYYHVGLYLNKSRYKNITGKRTGPKTWGCSLYSRPAKRKMKNGLDCSGFVSWALLNAGFNVKDVGAGWSDNRDLTDYGTVKKLTDNLATSNKIKVGDLLHSTRAGGHIAIIVGIDKNYYYVAQALWYGEKGVVITKYKKKKLNSDFPHVILMDKYYKEDGNLTNMW